MNINKVSGSILGSLTLMAAAMAPAFAAPGDQQTFAGANGVNSATVGASTVFTFSGGPGGTFNTTPGANFVASSAIGAVNAGSVLTFTGVSATGPATGTGVSGDPFTEPLSGGSFTLKDNLNNNLLSGTFGSSNVLTAFTSASTASITDTVNDVTYTGGSYFTASGLNNPGSFAINLTSVAPPPTKDGGGFLSGFTAGGGVTFSATTPRVPSVPEPATFVPFALGGMALFGLIVRGRKSRRISGAAA